MSTIVSIIMPAYNCDKTIADSIDSVINQTFKNWELIIIDDGSRDNTYKVIREFKSIEPRIKVYKNNDNMGVSKTRNRGLEFASGEWIAFLDSDDTWEPVKLEKQFEVANQFSAEFIFTGASYINEKGIPFNGIFEVPHIIGYKALRKHNVISCSSVLVKSKYFQSIRMEDDNLHEDYVVWLRILKLGIMAYGINEPLIIYRISKDSKSGNKIKSVKMTYKVFRFIGINAIGSMYFTFRHLIASIKKYKNIFS